MNRQRQKKPILKNWYQNLDDNKLTFRKNRTASGKRNFRVINNTTDFSSQDKIKEVQEDLEFHPPQPQIVTEEAKLKTMKKMVKEAYSDHLNSEEHLITYPNDYIEWSLGNTYSDIVQNELKEFNYERSFKILNEKEVDYIFEMMETRKKDFKKTEMLQPFYLKAHNTFKSLGETIGLSDLQIDSFIKEFKTIEF